MKQRSTSRRPSRPTLKRALLATLILLLALTENKSQAQWQIQPAPTTANLRGIQALPNGIAWASGTEGTVLRTTDDGTTWQRCPTPPAAEKLDFRGIQAFDAQTAIVMSSGKGDLSRLYKTTDACQTWKLLFTNPDPEGFWDAISFPNLQTGWVLGDPVHKSFALFLSRDGGTHWIEQKNVGLKAKSTQGAFAASNSSLLAGGGFPAFASGGAAGSSIYFEITSPDCPDYCPTGKSDSDGSKNRWMQVDVPIGSRSDSSGIFAMGERSGKENGIRITVGGDYTKQSVSEGTAAYFDDASKLWIASAVPPHGYRSSVAYDEKTKTWITVGPNGTDISTDDGRNWRPLKPIPTDPPDADQNWNALSLPFAVGPHGRIGKLHPDALKP